MSELSHVFSPITIGNMEVKNRFTISGHVNCMAGWDGLPSEREMRYLEARAKGGFGMIVMGAAAVNPHVALFPCVVNGWRDEIIPWYQKYSDAVHAHGAKLLVQAWHNGHSNVSAISHQHSQSASQVPSCAVGEAPAELTVTEIKQIVQDYADFALRCKKGGLDGVELHGGHGYLIQDFLSPSSNIRTDEYGGSLENRMRFSLEVIAAMREAVGPDFVVGNRFSADEFLSVGLDQEDMKEIAQIWAETGHLDYLSVSGGTYKTIWPFIAPMMMPSRPFVYLAAEIRQIVDIPVIAAVKINDPAMANDIIENGEADMVVMTRASIADAELPNKARAGRIDDIRQCIACNQGCWAHAEKGLPITCLQNPETGFEGVFTVEPTDAPKKVMVIGGGPAGMKAAAVAKERGHDVTLYEKSSELGGALKVPGLVASRQDWSQAVRFLEHELKRVGVKVVMDTEVTPEMVQQEGADAVILATGANTQQSTAADVVGPDFAIEIAEGAQVVTAEDVIEGTVETGQKVVIADFQNYMKGLATAEFLADQGKEVTVVMPWMLRMFHPNPYDMDKMTYGLTVSSLEHKGVKRIADYTVKKAAPGTVTIRNNYTEQDQEIEADTLVTSYWRSSETELFKTLEGKVANLHRIGDCIAPRLAMDAIYEGYQLGRQI
jgi:2,4-dienoyl-CoA reductase-like NADH-dependent reductase (Old Yellow Enzyme family)/thioredoxin reductase